MNPKLREINEIIDLCDLMVKHIETKGIIRSGNNLYCSYKNKIKAFLNAHDLMDNDYAPFCVLRALYFEGKSYTVNLSEAEMIRKVIIDLKHELFPDCFEKIFISHREKDKRQVDAFVDLLYSIGIPRPTASGENNLIFCTSHPAAYISNGERNLDTIRSQFSSAQHIFYILWYSDNYFESYACLNEAGAIWAMQKKYQEILAPGFESSHIGGLLDKQPVWFKANDKFRLNSFREQIEKMFGLEPLANNNWELARDKFIQQVEKTD